MLKYNMINKQLRVFLNSSRTSTFYFIRLIFSAWDISKHAELDTSYLCNNNNIKEIERNILNRKGVGDIRLINELKTKIDETQASDKSYESIKQRFYEELLKIPNRTHPEVSQYGQDPKLVKYINKKNEFNFEPREFHEITRRLNLVRTEHLGSVSGSRSYFLLGEMAELEYALINYFLEKLVNNNFQLITVPDILPREIIERCGMNTRGERNQVYSLDTERHGPDLCLSGTSEMAIAGYLSGKVFNEEELPLKLTAVSRCYRAETSKLAEERGIFRVHEFTKVEMFVVSTPENSDSMLEVIRSLEEESFASLGIHFQVLDMPPHELGAQAYRKYDIEAWMPGRGLYGEISSCSNCTDYQSRKLGIKYKSKDGDVKFVHTLNGTACAVPRLLITLAETGQNDKGGIHIPEVLHKYMSGKTIIRQQKGIPVLKLVKIKKQ